MGTDEKIAQDMELLIKYRSTLRQGTVFEDSPKGSPGIRTSRMMLVSTAVIIPTGLPHQVVAALPF
jgi:hypothetical protein